MNPTITIDRETATFTVEARYDAEPERIWRLWADPRQLERWWGPPTHPATVTDHDLSPGGIVRYYMTSPEGEKFAGAWRVVRVEAPHTFEFEDYFEDDSGNENTDLPISRSTVTIERSGGGPTVMTMTTRYDGAAALEQILAMGMEEGVTLAVGQIDALLTED